MSKFKVGDRVRQVGDAHWRGMTGVYAGIQQDNSGYDWEYFTPDADATFADGSSHGYAGELCGMKVGSFEPIDTPTPPIPAPIAERMRGLIERMAAAWPDDAPFALVDEARAIMAELAPVDPEAVASEEILGKIALIWNDPEYMIRQIKDAVTAAIRKGRELEREGYK